MAEVVLEKVNKVWQDSGAHAVRDVDLCIDDGEFVVLVGPSGCGKSTTLRMIAGLEDLTTGTISIGGRPVNGVPAADRDIAMVFQDYALYPHMSVYQNMAFSLKLRKVPKPEIDRRVREAARMLSLEPYFDRRPKALSGGQRQRVAMGRAIVRNPSVFLFDEPLSNLDATMRVELRAELNTLRQALDSTMIYVTHDQIEAMTLGDRIVVMNDGVVQQFAEPLTVYSRPANAFVARFIGTPPMNLFEGTLTVSAWEQIFHTETFSLYLPEWMRSAISGHHGRRVLFGVRPEDLRLSSGPAPVGSIGAHMVLKETLGNELILHLEVGGMRFRCRADPHDHPPLQEELAFSPIYERCHVFDAARGDNLTIDAWPSTDAD